MLNRVLGLVAIGLRLAACTYDKGVGVEYLEVDGVSVYAYEAQPHFMMDALSSGTLVVEDGCLLLNGAVVVWWPEHLEMVELAIAGIESGGAPMVELGGGGVGTVGEMMGDLNAACASRPVWYAGDYAELLDLPASE